MRGLHGPFELQHERKTRQDAALDAEGPAGLSACPPPPIPESRGPRTPFLFLHVGEGSWHDAGDAMRCFLDGHIPQEEACPALQFAFTCLKLIPTEQDISALTRGLPGAGSPGRTSAVQASGTKTKSQISYVAAENFY